MNITKSDLDRTDQGKLRQRRARAEQWRLARPDESSRLPPQLRRLYEQRFSRRMSFSDFQRQIEIVNDAALVEQWKEEARKQTKFITRKEDPPQTFASEAEAERNFREKYLPGLVSEKREAEIDGPTSRHLPDHESDA